MLRRVVRAKTSVAAVSMLRRVVRAKTSVATVSMLCRVVRAKTSVAAVSMLCRVVRAKASVAAISKSRQRRRRHTMTDQPDTVHMTFQEFRRVIARELQIEEEHVIQGASFMEDLHADSIQLVNLMLRMEELGIGIPWEAAWEVETVGDAYRLYTENAESGA
jgi:acyl carrier protein